MKTIEEAAGEFVKEWNGYHLPQQSCFVEGARFAQKWIPIEEELPPLIETVNAVFEMGNCGDEVVVSAWRGIDADGKNKYMITLTNVVLFNEPIKWRPINRK